MGEGDLDGRLAHLPVARVALGRDHRSQRQQPRGQDRCFPAAVVDGDVYVELP